MNSQVVNDFNAQLKPIAMKISVLQEKGTKISDDEQVQLKTLTAEGKSIREKLDAYLESSEFTEWSQKSAGSTVRDGMKASMTQELTDDADKDQEQRAQETAAKRAYKGVFEGMLRGRALPNSNNPLSAGDMKILREGAIKAANESTETSGGFTVPEDFQANVLKKEPGLISLWDNVKHQPTSRDVLVWPIVRYTTDNKYTAPHRLTFTGETAASATTADVTDETWGQVRIPINVAMAGQKLSNSLIEDSAVDVMGLTQQLFRENIMQDLEYYVAQGTGSGQPEGITVNATAQTNYVASTSTTVPTADTLKKMYWTLPAQYRARAVWVMTSAMAYQIALLKDSNGRYIWEDKDMFGGGLGGSQLDGIIIPTPRLLGAPVRFSEQMPTIASNAFPVVYGDLSGYVVPERVGMTVRVLNELYAETDQVKVLLRVRVGGQLAEDYKVNLYKMAAS